MDRLAKKRSESVEELTQSAYNKASVLKKKPTKRDIESQKKQDHIYKTAIKLFLEYGFDNTTIEDISRATGMSAGSIYHFFDNKKDILKRLPFEIERGGEVYLETTKDNLAEPQKAIMRYFEYIAQRFDEIGWDLAQHLHGQFSEIWTQASLTLQDQYGSARNLIPFIEASQKAGTLDAGLQAGEIAHIIYIVVEGIMCTWAFQNSPYTLRSSMQEVLPRMLNTFIT